MEALFAALPLYGNIISFALGFLIITKAAGWFIHGAVSLARRTGVSKVVVGATIVSLTTTAPEFSVSFLASLVGQPQTAVGNAVGSAICNIGLILGLAALISPIAAARPPASRQGVIMLACGLALAGITLRGELSRWGAGLLLLGLAGYILYSIASARGRVPALEEAGAVPDARSPFFRFVAGGLGVVVGSVLLVKNAAILARTLGVPELVIALTLVAVGTSLPELVTALAASRAGHGDLALGNVLGANILNILWVLGGAGLARPLILRPQTLRLDLPAMLLMMALLLVFAFASGRLGRGAGACFMAAYAGYLLVILTLFI